MLPFFGLAYDDKTTHPALTQEVVKFFNKSFPENILNNADAELVIQGSIEEDSGIRWMRHFYDPIYNRGLTLSTKEQQLAQVSAALNEQTGKSGNWPNAKNWAQDSNLQADFANSLSAGLWQNYFSSDSDYSWERAIYEYTWGDKNRGLAGLGHILHLLEDMSVPDHTRNDPHPPVLDMGSPYESWTTRFNRENLIIEPIEKPAILSDLNDYFNNIANYSNNNFFSKDTILDKSYNLPTVSYYANEVLSNEISYTFAYSKNNYRLFRVDEILTWQEVIKSTTNDKLYLQDNDNLILSDYWSLLSQQAVLNGAGVIKLFLDEAEKEKQSKIFYEKNKSWLSKEIDKFKNATNNLASAIFGVTSNTVSPLAIPQEEKENPELESIINLPEIIKTPPIPILVNTAPANITVTPAAEPLTSTSTLIPTLAPTPTSTASAQNSENVGGSPGWSYQPTPDPNIPTTIQTPTTTPIELPTSTSSPILEPTPSTDTTPPDISLAITECGQSFSSSTCLLVTTTINLFWSSISTDLARYNLTCETNSLPCPSFDFASTTATSTTYNLSDNASYIFRARAIDTNENQSPEKVIQVTVNLRPIIINEIAWMGTSPTKTQDEWIELYNPTFYPISLAGLNLISETDYGGPNIQLSGAIPARGFYLIERTDDTAISDITASTTASFGNGLNNNGEVLALKYGSTTIDRTPAAGLCLSWCGGEGNPYFWSMERVDPLTSGEDKNNWGSFGSFFANGKNKDGLAINGTPGKRNSLHYLIDKIGLTLSQDKTLKKADSPYVIASPTFTIQNEVTLTIEPGVVIKFFNYNLSLTVNGIIKAEGTIEDPIVFTSLRDDTFDGDTNQDATSTTPQPGDWGTIKITKSGSILNHAILRYGGFKDFPQNSIWANLRVENADFILKNSTLEESLAYGAWLKNASGAVENNIIRNNNQNTDGYGMMVQGGALDIKNNNFNHNSHGLFLANLDGAGNFKVENNQFLQQTYAPIHVVGAYPHFSGNTATGNGQNDIIWEGSLQQDYTFSPDLPYVIPSTTFDILTGQTLTILPGTIIKLSDSGRIYVHGKLVADGTPSQKIIFTSFNDDDCGITGGCGDTNATTTPPAPGDWSNLSFFSTSTVSTLNNVVIRYGGSKAIFTPEFGALRTKDASLEISHTNFENNYRVGAWLENSASTTIRDSIFKNHREPAPESVTGLYLLSSSPLIQNTIFENNKTGIFADSFSSITNGGGNQFINNTTNTTPAGLLP